MSLRAFRLAAAAAAIASLAGCSVLGIDLNNEKVQYESSNSRANLEVPPDLTPIANDNRFSVPSRTGVVSANAMAEQQAREAAAAASGDDAASRIVPLTTVAKVMKDGTDRWLRVNAEPEQLWPVVQDFWPSVGLVVRSQNPKTGYMETEWAENRAKLPQDVIRRTVGKIIDFAYSTGEQDQYRVRLERVGENQTDIYLAHRSMVEVVTGRDNESSVWQPGPTDPTMEAEMLQRLALRIDAEFNPQANGESQKVVADQLAHDLEIQPVQPKATTVEGADGKTAAVLLTDGYDQAWRRVGLVIDRMGFELVDRDRTAGWFLVRYLDPGYEAQVKESRGFFANVFGSDKAVNAPSYRIHLAEEGSASRLTVQDAEGGADKTGVAPNILNLLAEQLR